MSDLRRDIKTKFSGFEPEIDKASINRSWEKIKYFLPQQKKRRKFLFFKTAGFLSFLALLGLLCTGIITLHYFKTTNAKKDLSYKLEKTKKEKEMYPGPYKKIKKKLKEQTKSRPAYISKNNKIVDLITSKTKMQKNYKSNSLFSSKMDVTKNNRHTILPVAANQTSGAISLTKQKEKEDAKSAGDQVDSLTYLKLDLITIDGLFSNQNVDLKLALKALLQNDISMKIPNSRKFRIELFGGPNLADTKMDYTNGGSGSVNKQTNFFLGLGAVYQFKNKWSMNGSFIMSGNKFNAEEKTTDNKFIDRKAPVKGTFPPQDSVTRYVLIHSDKIMSSTLNYNINLGIGYSIYQKNKFNVEAFIQLSLKSSVYNFSNRNTEDKDTLAYAPVPVYVPVSSSTTFTSIVQPREQEYKTSYHSISLGLMSGIGLRYDITGRIAVLAKLFYFKQLTKNKTLPEQKISSLTQDNLFISLGLSLKL